MVNLLFNRNIFSYTFSFESAIPIYMFPKYLCQVIMHHQWLAFENNWHFSLSTAGLWEMKRQGFLKGRGLAFLKNRTIEEKAKTIDWIAPLINHEVDSRVFKTDHHLDIQLEKSQDFKFKVFHPLKKLTCQFSETNHSWTNRYRSDS